MVSGSQGSPTKPGSSEVSWENSTRSMGTERPDPDHQKGHAVSLALPQGPHPSVLGPLSQWFVTPLGISPAPTLPVLFSSSQGSLPETQDGYQRFPIFGGSLSQEYPEVRGLSMGSCLLVSQSTGHSVFMGWNELLDRHLGRPLGPFVQRVRTQQGPVHSRLQPTGDIGGISVMSHLVQTAKTALLQRRTG